MLEPAYKLSHIPSTTHGRLHLITEGDSWDDIHLRPGVTTVLDRGGPEMPWLKAWKERVGEQEAERIRLDATDRGTALHALIESNLTGEAVIIPDEAYALGQPNRDRIASMFSKIQPVLENDIEEVVGVELPAQWSDPSGRCGLISNGFAGSIDCIARVEGQLALLDWKTAAKQKRLDRIENYRIQVAGAYRAAFEYTYPQAGPIEACYIVIIPERGELQIVHIPLEEFETEQLSFLDRLETYYDQLGWPPAPEFRSLRGAEA